MSISSHGLAPQLALFPRSRLRQSLAMLVLLFIVGCEYLPERGPNGMATDDAPLSVAVAEALTANPETGQLRLTVTNPSEGKVRLQGNVDNNGLRATAEQIAASVDGVKSVINTMYLY